MRVSKWGNSLAIRLPGAVVKALGLRGGDEIEVVLAGSRRFEVQRSGRRDRAIERLKALRAPLPEGFRFEREEANAR